MPLHLFSEEEIRGSGTGPAIEIGSAQGNPLQLTLTIHRIMEQQTLDISIWGSRDGLDWGARPLQVLPHKYYCGTYYYDLDLGDYPDVRFLRLDYRLNAWGSRAPTSLAAFSMSAEVVYQEALTAVG